ncbi:MAG: helix-turn-helix transcriptional regulator [Opitutaceae bacterium]|nr:helix-turn-helix transcriptional regulator [Opitutaceae bacterium]
MTLTHFIGSELVMAIGRLGPAQVLGPWRQHTPAARRRGSRFVPALYDDNHAHPHAELCLWLEGQGVFSRDHAAAIVQAGDLVVCPAEHAHGESFARPGGAYRLAGWNMHAEEPTLHVTRYTRRGGFVLDHLMSLSALPAEARKRLDSLRQLAAGQSAPNLETLREALLTLTLALYRRTLEAGAAQLDTRAQLVRRAADFVKARARGPLTLADVARAVHVSPNYLTGLFRAGTGASLGRFNLAERVACAQEMLRAPGASVKAVALELGFADPFTFSRAFKRVAGRPPSAWLTPGPSLADPAPAHL